MSRKSIFFSKRTDPSDFNQIVASLTDYFSALHQSGCHQFDQVEISLDKGAEQVPVPQLQDRAFRERLAQELLKEKLPAIRQYHPGVEPTLSFKEKTGMHLISRTFLAGAKQLSYTLYLGGNSETVAIEGFKNNVQFTPAQYYAFFRWNCEYLQPDYGHLTSSTIQKQQKLPEFFFGWMNYFSNSIALPTLPAGYEVEDMHGRGKLLITTRDAFEPATNPAHQEKAMQLVEVFRKHGVVRPQ
jgi:hypothetical protein